MDHAEIRNFICEIGRRAWAREMGAANGGNYSVLLDDSTILCTPSGVSKGFMTHDMICHTDRSGALLGEKGGLKPSSEMKMHLAVYDRRDEVRAVVHAHPLYATVHAICGKPMTAQIMPESTTFLGEVPLAPYGLRLSDELTASIAPFIATHDAILLENHGALAYGHDLQSAWFKSEASATKPRRCISPPASAVRRNSAPKAKRLLDLKRRQFAGPGAIRSWPAIMWRAEPGSGGPRRRKRVR